MKEVFIPVVKGRFDLVPSFLDSFQAFGRLE
jgi:hypothetical protein